MPLRDHFRPPFSDRHSWDEVHGGWPMVIVQQLGRVLPPEYSAGPRVHLGREFEVDVATFESAPPLLPVSDKAAGVGAIVSGGAKTSRWAPAAPDLAFETELSDFDEYEVRIYDQRHERRLVAAIELISPSNKDRPEHRTQFVSKCAALLRQDVSLVLVDIITERHANLYAELLGLLGEQDPALGEEPPATYAVSCRWCYRRTQRRWLETWRGAVTPGTSLPCLPLWLGAEVAIPLDLEASYEQTCRDLRIG